MRPEPVQDINMGVVNVRFPILALVFLTVCNSVEIDKDGYVVYCPCMGRFGNQADHFLGAFSFAMNLNRTLILPPWVEYHSMQPRSVQVPFDTYFNVNSLKAAHRVITMEDFMKRLAPIIWPAGDRIVICYRARGAGGCNAKDGNPFGPFWDTFKIDFDKSEFYGPLDYNTAREEMRNGWQTRFPASAYPVLAFVGAPAVFPVAEHNLHLHRYLTWSDDIRDKAERLVREQIGSQPFVGLHIRNGSDFKNACSHITEHYHLFASPQCLGYHFEHGDTVTPQLCFPPEHLVVAQVRATLQKVKATTVYLATDDPSLGSKLRRILNPVQVVHQRAASPHVDLAVLGMADHAIVNCVSSFSAFAARERRANGKPISFWAFPSGSHDEL